MGRILLFRSEFLRGRNLPYYITDMQFLKNLASSTLRPLLEDEFTIPLSEHDVYSVISRCEIRQKSKSEEIGEVRVEVQEKKQVISVSPEDELVRLSDEPSFEVIEERIRCLKRMRELVEQSMLAQYQRYSCGIRGVIETYESQREIALLREKSGQLRARLANITWAIRKSRSVTIINIKANNIRLTLKIMQGIPKVQSLRIIELIQLQKMLKKGPSLQCLSRLGQYIKKSEQVFVDELVQEFWSILVDSVFREGRYEQILSKYVAVSRGQWELHKFIRGVVETEVRLIEQYEHVGGLFKIAETLVKITVNLHKVIRHHEEHAQRLQKLESGQMATNVCQIFDSHLAILLTDQLMQQPEEIHLELIILNRLVRIGYCFSGYFYRRTVREIEKKLGLIMDRNIARAIKKVNQELGQQEVVEWNRLPVQNGFRVDCVDSMLRKVMSLRQDVAYRMYSGKRNRSNTFFIELLINPQQKEGLEELLVSEREEETFSLKQYRYPSEVTASLQADPAKETIISRSALALLTTFESHIRDCAYLSPLSRKSIQCMVFLVEYYMFYILNAFLSVGLKRLIYDSFDDVEKKYLKKRLANTYPQLFAFLNRFKRSKELEVKEARLDLENVARVRVIATESCRYLVSYLAEVLCRLGVKEVNLGVRTGREEGLAVLGKVQGQMCQLLFVDGSQKIANVEYIRSLLKTSRWIDDPLEIKSYSVSTIDLMRESFKKVKYRGEVPSSIEDTIKGFMFKTQIMHILKIFTDSGSRNYNVFEQFVDVICGEVGTGNESMMETYRLVKSVMEVLICGEWQMCGEKIKKVFMGMEFVYSIVIALMEASECFLGVGQAERLLRKQEINDWLERQLQK